MTIKVSPITNADLILQVVPGLMQVIRAEMRRNRMMDLSVPQFRCLAFIKRNSGTSLTAVADHLGLTLPSASKLVDGLHQRGLVERIVSDTDRRRMTLSLTDEGENSLNYSIQCARDTLIQKIANLSAADQAVAEAGLQVLKRAFEINGA